MYIEGPPGTGKTGFLADKFVELVSSGVSMPEIIVICANSHQKALFLSKVKEKLEKTPFQGSGSFPVFTFNGVVYHCIKNNWPLVEQMLEGKLGKREFLPDLSGLGVSEFLLKESIKKINKDEDLEHSFRDYASHKNLKQQLFRRFRLIVENNLSKQEVDQKSASLNESFAIPAEKAINDLKKRSLQFRTLDFLRQTSIFTGLLEQGKIDFRERKYLLADDFDELSYSAHCFVKHLVNNVKEFYIVADPDGGARRGYLCANPQGYEELKNRVPSEIRTFKPDKEAVKTYEDAYKIYHSIQTDVVEDLRTIKLVDNSVRHVEMTDQFFKTVKDLVFNEKISPDELVIVAPTLDETLIHTLKRFFSENNIEHQFFSGSKKILDDKLVYGTVILLQLINTQWKFPPKTGEIRQMLTGMLGFPAISCREILGQYGLKGRLCPDIRLESEGLNAKYTKIIRLIEEIQSKTLKIEQQIEKIFLELIRESLTELTPLENFNLMLESLRAFQKIAAKSKNNYKIDREWIVLIKDTVVSDNPASSPDIESGCVKIATPQKVIDLELRSKLQLWLDVSSPAWFKEDTGPLYNSWVFRKNWGGEQYTPQLHKQLTAEKTACIARKLTLCASEKILCFASQLDRSGSENDGLLVKYLSGKGAKPEINYEFTPRPDQAPVMKYTGGEMAISAVPGAGKTKILEALIIKMITQGIDPEKILVLTYMDSAARNIRDRIKDSCVNLTKFPYISTIHSLGMNIIKDGDNNTRLNLSPDFRICDDSVRFRIMGGIYDKLSHTADMALNGFMNDYGAAISTAKQLEIAVEEAEKFLCKKNRELYGELAEFVPVYREYQQALRSRGMIDFDDILIYSVKLLRDNPEICGYYRTKFDFIIEDEAQDSSALQQELLSLINKGNLIRCGDPNQAITSSFSPSEVDNFKDFIKNTSNTVEMTGSQRCAPGVFELANSLVEWAEAQPELKGAFNNLHIKPVPGKNPEVKNSVKTEIYPTQDDEKHNVLEEVKRIRQSGEQLSIGVLLRGNRSVMNWTAYLEDNGIPCICYSDAVGQKKMFRFARAFLEVLNNPWNNYFIKELYREFSGENLIKTDFDSKHFLDKLGTPFIYFSETDLPYESLREFRRHVLKWLEKSDIPPEQLVNEIGDFYFKGVIDRSNTRIISLLISRHKNNFTDNEKNEVVTLAQIVEFMRELAMRKRLSGVRFFEEIEKNEHKNGFVQLMTVHKAKGLEFDVVFLPEVQEKMPFPPYYAIKPESINIGPRDRRINQIRQAKGKHLPVDQIKRQQIHEHLRLIYVGITRAKQYLYLSASEIGDTSWSKNKKFSPSELLEHFGSGQVSV